MNLGAILLAVFLTTNPEDDALNTITSHFNEIGRGPPKADAPLTRAARALAKEAALEHGRVSSDSGHAGRIISDAGGWDANPRMLLFKASPPEKALEALHQRADLAASPASNVGIGWSQSGTHGALVVLFTERKVDLEPYPRSEAHPFSRPLCGRIHPPLHAEEIDITLPQNRVERVPLKEQLDGRFCSTLELSTLGRFTIEVLAKGPQGPEVAATFYTTVGDAESIVEVPKATEPRGLAEGRSAVYGKINALRAQSHAKPLTLDPKLSAVAQEYSERMAHEHFFAHVAPDGTTVRQRLKQHGVSYPFLGENLGTAAGPISAEAAIERSPGHLKNLIDPAFTHLGIGIAQEQVQGQPQTVVTEIFAGSRSAPGQP